MSEFKWKKELIAWADGRRVQMRMVGTQKEIAWVELDACHCWDLSDDGCYEYRIYDLEVGSVYRLTFRDSNRLPVFAVYTHKGYFVWISANEQRDTLPRYSDLIFPVKFTDKVL